MYYCHKCIKGLHTQFLKKRMFQGVFLTFIALFFLFPVTVCHGEASVKNLPGSDLQMPKWEVDSSIYEKDPDFMHFSPMNLVRSYVDQMHKDMVHGSKNTYSPDKMIIPDKRNAGIQENTELKLFPKSGYIGKISDAEGGSGRKPLYLTVHETGVYDINGFQNTNCASRIVIENYNFEDAQIYLTYDQEMPEDVVLIFKNCKFGRMRSIPNSRLWIILDHCRIEGNIYASNMMIRNCYLHSDNHDAINPISNIIVKDSYVADLLQKPSNFGVHIDGVQIFGNQYGGISENIIFDNVRFSAPQLCYEDSGDYVNAAICTGLEFSEGGNFLFQNIIIDAGGRWFPIYSTGGDYVLFNNVRVGHGHRAIFYPKYINPNAVVRNTGLSQGLYVSSVWKDPENKTHFLCSNNTGTERTLTVDTNQQKYTFKMKRHPTPAELSENPKYQSARFEDLPYDIEFIIDEDIDQAVFYDRDRQIRSVIF